MIASNASRKKMVRVLVGEINDISQNYGFIVHEVSVCFTYKQKNKLFLTFILDFRSEGKHTIHSQKLCKTKVLILYVLPTFSTLCWHTIWSHIIFRRKRTHSIDFLINFSYFGLQKLSLMMTKNFDFKYLNSKVLLSQQGRLILVSIIKRTLREIEASSALWFQIYLLCLLQWELL